MKDVVETPIEYNVLTTTFEFVAENQDFLKACNAHMSRTDSTTVVCKKSVNETSWDSIVARCKNYLYVLSYTEETKEEKE